MKNNSENIQSNNGSKTNKISRHLINSFDHLKAGKQEEFQQKEFLIFKRCEKGSEKGKEKCKVFFNDNDIIKYIPVKNNIYTFDEGEKYEKIEQCEKGKKYKQKQLDKEKLILDPSIKGHKTCKIKDFVAKSAMPKKMEPNSSLMFELEVQDTQKLSCTAYKYRLNDQKPSSKQLQFDKTKLKEYRIDYIMQQEDKSKEWYILSFDYTNSSICYKHDSYVEHKKQHRTANFNYTCDNTGNITRLATRHSFKPKNLIQDYKSPYEYVFQYISTPIATKKYDKTTAHETMQYLDLAYCPAEALAKQYDALQGKRLKLEHGLPDKDSSKYNMTDSHLLEKLFGDSAFIKSYIKASKACPVPNTIELDLKNDFIALLCQSHIPLKVSLQDALDMKEIEKALTLIKNNLDQLKQISSKESSQQIPTEESQFDDFSDHKDQENIHKMGEHFFSLLDNIKLLMLYKIMCNSDSENPDECISIFETINQINDMLWKNDINFKGGYLAHETVASKWKEGWKCILGVFQPDVIKKPYFKSFKDMLMKKMEDDCKKILDQNEPSHLPNEACMQESNNIDVEDNMEEGNTNFAGDMIDGSLSS